MCGIVGFVADNTGETPSAILRRMADSVSHRGPDGEGFFEGTFDGGSYFVGLGHRRLSIIDLESGDQPIGNEDGSIQIVFNGEIYNFPQLRNELIRKGHHFSTSSDTEVIVHAYEEYGKRCVDYLRGMFAFVLWDAKSEKLLLARDRFGKKPVYICEAAGALIFSSEIKAILAFPGVTAQVDWQAVWEYFAYRYVPGPATLFKGIRKLPPGKVLTWQKGSIEETRYYSPPDQKVWEDNGAISDPVRSFLETLNEAVKVRMISDVPFGAFLSGGIDSSTVVCLMARHSSLPIKTFSVGFPEKEYSELSYTRLIAEQFRTDHHELIVSEADLMGKLPELVSFRDAPVSEPSDIPIYLLSKEASRTVKMVLTGEGSDEILGGYQKHVFERYVRTYQRLPSLLRHGLLEPLIYALPYQFQRAKTAIHNLGLEEREDRLPRWFGAVSNDERRSLVAFSLPHSSPSNGTQFLADSRNSDLRRILYFDQTSWLPDNLLERGDRMTMAASLEARMPFLDQNLVAFVSSLPDHYRIRGWQTKWILRKAVRDLLPAVTLERPKIGFRVPVNEWFQGPMRDYLYEHLISAQSKTKHYYKAGVLNKILEDHVYGRQNHEKLLWTLLNLEIWHRLYV